MSENEAVRRVLLVGCAAFLACSEAPLGVEDLAVGDAVVCSEPPPSARQCIQGGGVIPCCTEGEVYCQLTITCLHENVPPFTVDNVCMQKPFGGGLGVYTEFYECPIPDLAYSIVDAASDGG